MYQIHLRHLMHHGQKHIGVDFKPNKVLNTLIRSIEGIFRDKEAEIHLLPNNKENIQKLFETFRGVAWINGQQFFHHGKGKQSENCDLSWYRKRKNHKGFRFCPIEMYDKLEIRNYSMNTAKIYINAFEKFINHYPSLELNEITEVEIRQYLLVLNQQGLSRSTVNLAINAIKFYYEVVLGMPQQYYHIERPIKAKKLPKVLSKEEIALIINNIQNIKHKAMVCIMYGGGLRRSEVLNLMPKDINSKRMMIHIRNAKNNKDRMATLSKTALHYLRKYFKEYRPTSYLFEGQQGGMYSPVSLSLLIKRAAKRAGIIQNVSTHMFRHSYATHMLEAGMDLRTLQVLLGHSDPKTTTIYAQVSSKHLGSFDSPLDSLNLEGN